MNDEPKVWYPAKNLAAGETKVLDTEECHILWKGIFLCRKPLFVAIQEARADKGVTRSGAIPGSNMCHVCQEMYKANPEFPYRRWVMQVKGE
jgi:hypothetical protein